jgi:hypothetical protein
MPEYSIAIAFACLLDIGMGMGFSCLSAWARSCPTRVIAPSGHYSLEVLAGGSCTVQLRGPNFSLRHMCMAVSPLFAISKTNAGAMRCGAVRGLSGQVAATIQNSRDFEASADIVANSSAPPTPTRTSTPAGGSGTPVSARKRPGLQRLHSRQLDVCWPRARLQPSPCGSSLQLNSNVHGFAFDTRCRPVDERGPHTQFDARNAAGCFHVETAVR